MNYFSSDGTLRYKVYERIAGWDAHTNYKSHKLAALLGYDGWYEMVEGFTDRDRKVCEMLLGGNGHAVYKMLLARKR